MGRSRLDEVLDEMSDDEPVQRTSFDGSEGGSGVAGGGLEKGDDDEAKDDDDDMDDEDPENKKDEGKSKAEGMAKPKKTRPKFTENHIIGDMGIERIANTFPSICRFRGEGYEAEDLRRLLRCYKEWAFQLFPQLAFEDLLERVQKMSGKARVRKCLEDLREKERERYLAKKFGKDYADHVEEHRKQMIREEARREEERIKRREELYGPRNTTATTTTAASSGAAALPDGEIEIEDLGAAPDPEELERQRAREVARLQRIATEQARRKNGPSSKSLFDESSDEEAESATAAARKGKGSEGSDSESSSSDDSETEKQKPPPKRARLADDDDEAASDRLRTFVSDLIDRGEHLVMKVGQVVEQAKEKCDLQNHETENIRDVVKAMFNELTSDALLASQSQPATTSTSSSRPRLAAASAAAAALSEEAESSEGEELEIDQVSGSKKKDSEPQAAASEAEEEEAEEPVVETKTLIDYLENLITELPVEETTLKVVLGHVSRQFELTADDLAKIKPSVKTIVLDIASRPVAARGDKEGTEMVDETAEPETVAQDPVSAVPTAAVSAASEGEMEEEEPAMAMEEDGVVEGEKAEGTMGVMEGEEEEEPETIGQEKVVYSQAGIDAGASMSQGVFDRHYMGDDGEEEGKGKMMDDDSWASAPEAVVAGGQEDEMDVIQSQQEEEVEELEAPSADFAISQDY